MLKVGVIGATGYTGEELVKILLNHPKVKITSLAAKIEKERKFSEIFSKFLGTCDIECKNLDVNEVAAKCDILFLALPHGVSMQYADFFLKEGKKVIDLSADYRLKDTSLYEKWYGTKHTDEANLSRSVYGLPEIYKDEIKKANLIANPGCYPTISLLCLLPLVAKEKVGLKDIIIDAKSGITGAGRKAVLELHYSEVNENMRAYKINKHQHIPEINQELSKIKADSVQVTFVPHIVPFNRGILATVYVKYEDKINKDKIYSLYKEFYKDAPFVKVLDIGRLPQIQDVVHTNYCHLGITVDEEKNLIIIVGVIDNLVKGASGQAVENMNIMYGFKQEEGLV